MVTSSTGGGATTTTTTSSALAVTIPPTGTDAFVTKLGPTGAISYSTRLGSLGGLNALGDTWGRGIAVDRQGEAYVTGQTDSPDFPVTTLSPVTATSGLTNTTHGLCTTASPSGQVGGPCYDAFVTRLTADGTGLVYSAYLGGGRDDYGYGIAADSSGAAYVTGRTESADFPVSGTLQTFNRGGGGACNESACPDAFVAKLNTMAGLTATTGLGALPLGGSALWTLTGSATQLPTTPNLVWSTYLGGGGADEGTGLGLDRAGNAYIVGDTAALSGTATDDFPVTTGAYSTTYKTGTCPGGPCPDLFVTEVISDGSRLGYSSRFGGSGADYGRAIAVDSSGHAYVTGQTASADYPLIGSLQGFTGYSATAALTTSVAVVARLTKKGDGLLYSSYLGGSGGDSGTGVAVDTVGDVALTGQTGSTDLLTTTNALSPTFAGGQDAFLVGLDHATRFLTYGYDGLQRLTGVTETLGDAYGYGYDLAGNRTSVALNGAVTQYGYDAASQVTGTVDALGRTTPYSYDAAGNLTSDGTTQYTYDALNRLTALNAPSLQQTAAYTYTGDGTLVAQQANAVTTRYTQDLASPLPQVLQTAQGSATPTDYLYGQPVGLAGDAERLASTTSGGSTHTWYVADLQGSVRYTQDDSGSSGSSLNYDPTPLQYDPYGMPGGRDSGLKPQTFGYRGALHDSATGLVYLRARMYNPALGQFLTRDPLEQQTGQAYTYANDAPTNNADPSGLCAIPTVGGGHQRLVGVGPADGPCGKADIAYLAYKIVTGQGTQAYGPHTTLSVPLSPANVRCVQAQFQKAQPLSQANGYAYTSVLTTAGGATAGVALRGAAGDAIDVGELGSALLKAAVVAGAVLVDAAEVAAAATIAVVTAPEVLTAAAVIGTVAVGAGLVYLLLRIPHGPLVRYPNPACPPYVPGQIQPSCPGGGTVYFAPPRLAPPAPLTPGGTYVPVGQGTQTRREPQPAPGSPPNAPNPPAPTATSGQRCGQIPRTIRIGGYCVGPYRIINDGAIIPLQDREDPDGVMRQAHHIIQNAAVTGRIPNYSKGLAPAVLLRGPTDGPLVPAILPEHRLATLPQRNPCQFGVGNDGGRTSGTYGIERRIADAGLRNAQIPAAVATQILGKGDHYRETDADAGRCPSPAVDVGKD